MILDDFREKVIKTKKGLDDNFDFEKDVQEVFNSMTKKEKKEFYSENYKKGDAVLAEKNGSLKLALIWKIKDEMFNKE